MNTAAYGQKVKNLDIAKTDAPLPSTKPSDRRRTRRFHCDGKVEVNRIPSTGKRQGTLRDLSHSGCCIELDEPFAAPSYLEVMIDTGSTRLRLTGTVKSCRKKAMGVEFAQVGSSARLLLQELIEYLESRDDPKSSRQG
jgi:hypothetical protein